MAKMNPLQALEAAEARKNRPPQLPRVIAALIAVVIIAFAADWIRKSQPVAEQHAAPVEQPAKKAQGITVGPAPKGEPAAVAQKIIQDNFGKSECPSVVKADRLGDDSINARCNNGERYRIFSVVNLGGKAVAMKCSAAAKMGVSGC